MALTWHAAKRASHHGRMGARAQARARTNVRGSARLLVAESQAADSSARGGLESEQAGGGVRLEIQSPSDLNPCCKVN